MHPYYVLRAGCFEIFTTKLLILACKIHNDQEKQFDSCKFY